MAMEGGDDVRCSMNVEIMTIMLTFFWLFRILFGRTFYLGTFATFIFFA